MYCHPPNIEKGTRGWDEGIKITYIHHMVKKNFWSLSNLWYRAPIFPAKIFSLLCENFVLLCVFMPDLKVWRPPDFPLVFATKKLVTINDGFQFSSFVFKQLPILSQYLFFQPTSMFFHKEQKIGFQLFFVCCFISISTIWNNRFSDFTLFVSILSKKPSVFRYDFSRNSLT